MIQFVFMTLLCILSTSLQAKNQFYGKKDLPLLEAGVGTIVLNIPDYPGSSHSSTHTIPFPAALYRGDVLRADDDGGTRSRFFNTENLEVNLSFGLAPRARSENNPDREGMPDLDTILELGPGLIYHFLKHSQYKNLTFDLSLPFRAAFSTDFKKLTERGFVFNPFLYLRRKNFLIKNFGFFLGIDSRFATKRNLANFYNVNSEFATVGRPQYSAKGGYLGTNLTVGLNYLFLNQLSFFIGHQYSTYHLAANTNSPLMARKNNSSYVIGLIWWFYESEARGRRL